VGKQKPREIAVRVLRRREAGLFYLEDLLKAELSQKETSDEDRRLAQELTYGVVRWQPVLDWLINRKTQGRAQKPLLRILLRLGLYQLFWLDRIPKYAAVFETVEMAKALGLKSQAGFINALLRAYAREEKETRQLLEKLKRDEPALGCSHPKWLCERWRKRWTRQELTALLEWNNSPPPTYARMNTLKADRPRLEDLWRKEGVEFGPVAWDWIPDNLMFRLESHPPLANLGTFEQGLWYIQDPSTLLSVQELDPKPDDQVLDLCAAPGGKTTFIAQKMMDRGKIVAVDVSRERLRLIRENCERLGVTCVESILLSDFKKRRPASYDRILIDAPCSNTGVMRRRVDLRWRIRPEEIARLSANQRDLLEQAAPQLKPGATLVYSTCSLEPEENEEVISDFLARHADFRLRSERRLVPFQHGVDGAYVARLKRTNQEPAAEF
jgi:16S rRNA (cytosine967-C5)-methyltransferase